VLSLNRILCPVDFSDASQHAIDHALAVARWYGARITALHACGPRRGSGSTGAEREPAIDLECVEARRLGTEVVAAFHAAHAMGVDVDVVVHAGHPVTEILECAVSTSADLIVMGTHGSGGFEHLVLGSVTEKVLRKAGCPVFTVPPRVRATSALPFRRLLCAVDFSPSSDRALEFACSLAQQSKASVTLLHVLEWPWHEPPAPAFDEIPHEQAVQLIEFRRQSEERTIDRLDALVPDAVRDMCPVVTRFAHGKPYVEILRIAAEEGADVVVLGVQGRNPLDLTLLGSTTNQVVRRASCPVLTVRR